MIDSCIFRAKQTTQKSTEARTNMSYDVRHVQYVVYDMFSNFLLLTAWYNLMKSTEVFLASTQTS